MTTTEKLQRIRSRCVDLLEIASKRTPGKWDCDDDSDDMDSDRYSVGTDSSAVCAPYYAADAAFIASCAGAAEAGWRATIRVIDQCLKYPYAFQENSMNPCNDIASDIIAAWPEELL